MSFSVKVKSEILRLQSERTEKISLLSSYIRNNAVITENSILINTENMEISKYIFELFKELYNIDNLIKEQLLIEDDSNIFIPSNLLFVSNEIIVRVLETNNKV